MRGADEEDVRFAECLLQRHERRVPDVNVGAENPPAFQGQEFPQFEGQRVANVVVVSLEGHAENGGRHVPQVVMGAGAFDEHGGQPFVDHHCRLTQHESVVVEGRQLHGVLQQTGPSGESRPRETGHARVIGGDCRVNPIEIRARISPRWRKTDWRWRN